MSESHLHDLEGPLAVAVQAAWDDELHQDRVDLATRRILDQLELAECRIAPALATLPKTSDRFAGRRGRSFASFTVAASMLIGAFFLGKSTSNRHDLAFVDHSGKATNLPTTDNKPQTFVFVTATPDPRIATGLAFLPRISVQAIRGPGSTDPTDVILFGKGPRESIALGQGSPVEPPKTKASLIHVFDPRVSPRSRVLTQNEVAGSFVVSPDGQWIVTQSGLQIEVETEHTNQLPGDWSQVQRVQFSGLDRLLLTRTGPGATGVDSCQLEILSYPTMKKLRDIIDLESGFVVTTTSNLRATDHEIGLLFADRKVRIYDTSSDKQTAEVKTAHNNTVRAIAISENRQWLATSSENEELFVHDFATGELKHRLTSGTEHPMLREARSIAFSPDNRYLAVGEAQRLVVYEVESGEVVVKFANSSGNCDQILWSSDSRSLTIVHGSFIQRYPDGHEESVYPYLSKCSFEIDQAN